MAGGLPSQQHKKKTCLSVTSSIMAMANALCAASADGNVEVISKPSPAWIYLIRPSIYILAT